MVHLPTCTIKNKPNMGEYNITYDGFQKIGVPENGWFIMENPIKMDDLGVPPFKETPILIPWEEGNNMFPRNKKETNPRFKDVQMSLVVIDESASHQTSFFFFDEESKKSPGRFSFLYTRFPLCFP